MFTINNNPEDNSSNPLQIFTLAHAVRPSKKLVAGGPTDKTHESVILNERKTNKLLKNSTSQQVKETLTIKYEATQNSQLRSRLPLNMIVSKMATRKPAQESDRENEDPYGNFDVSLCRKIKLAPPSWRNKSNQTKRMKPSGFTKIVDNMKEKCSQFNVHKQQDTRILSKDNVKSDLNHLLADVTRSAQDEMTASVLEYNYNKLYGKRQGQQTLVKCRDEDPLPDDFECRNSESQQEGLSVHQSHSATPEDFQFDLQCSSRPDEPTEFVWNPVIVTNSQSERLFTLAQERTRDDHLPQYEYLRETSWRPPSHDDHYYPTNHPPSLDSPYSPGNCETSSTSSGQTVAEERMQFIYYAARGRASQSGRHCTGIGQDSSSARFLWPNANSSFLKFLEE
ncbi:uncharacterized protein LOC124366966 [Homalodisca vitripennis]|uniref:uncharacterized protein LOC124366966 n=1 Tax=Homalodisca vitripennis TaxID=197043 RepID=UPI001EEA2B42|nr:uncharacterized protein LOC124366966 [Homalodisca vitripennis]